MQEHLSPRLDMHLNIHILTTPPTARLLGEEGVRAHWLERERVLHARPVCQRLRALGPLLQALLL